MDVSHLLGGVQSSWEAPGDRLSRANTECVTEWAAEVSLLVTQKDGSLRVETDLLTSGHNVWVCLASFMDRNATESREQEVVSV